MGALGAVCALDPRGRPRCDGGARWESTPVDTRLTHLVASWRVMCGLERGTGALLCWGDGRSVDQLFRHAPPAGPYTALASASGGVCALDEAGHISCWGDEIGQTAAPAGSFVELSLGYDWACGRTEAGAVRCWGAWDAQHATREDAAVLFSSTRHPCVRTTEGQNLCWRGDGSGTWSDKVLPADVVTYAAPEHQEGCGITSQGSLQCPRGNNPPGRWLAVDAGDKVWCALRDDGQILCWGGAELSAPGASDIGVGRGVLCVLEGEGRRLRCSGERVSDGQPSPGAGG